MKGYYSTITLTHQQIKLLSMALDSHNHWHAYQAALAIQQIGDDWDGDVGLWDGNDIMLLNMTSKEPKELLKANYNHPNVSVEFILSGKQLSWLDPALETQIRWLDHQVELASVGRIDNWDGSIGAWSKDDIALLKSTTEYFKEQLKNSIQGTQY